MANYVYIATSLDGYIARKDGSVDWLNEIPNPDNDDYGFSEFLERVDGIIMGRNTFELVHSFGVWPYTKPVFVLSNSLNVLPGEYANKAEILKGTPEAIIKSLNQRGLRDFYVDGGKPIQDFLKRDMIDELIITRVPILLGEGIPLFADMASEIRFEHIRTGVLGEQLVKSSYRKK